MVLNALLGSAEFYPVKRPRYKFKLRRVYTQEIAMFRTFLICAVVSASAIACSTAGKPVAADAKAARPCVIGSASRIPERPDQCSAGRSYTQEDVERTGKTDVGDALQMLDPTVTVHH